MNTEVVVPKTVNVSVNDQTVHIEKYAPLLLACQKARVEIPHFCYHKRLSIAGNCRMCLVEIQRGDRKQIVASCATPSVEGDQIFTESKIIKEMRASVMEMLLLNHPLDCPICDQGGECDLQDQAISYGYQESSSIEKRRPIAQKSMGPIIMTNMTRCIHCTRCVRFTTEVAGNQEIGSFYRGENMEIATYLDQSISSEISGNMIDICPVGALNAAPHAFQGRSWEMTRIHSIDVMDAMGSHTEIGVRNHQVIRILPRENEHINQEWLTDKARFVVDGLKNQRIDQPYIRKNGKLYPETWKQVLKLVAEKLTTTPSDKMCAIAGDLACMESMYMLKILMNSLGCSKIDCRPDGTNFPTENRESYLFNTSFSRLEEIDALLLIGCNPKWEAPLLNARLYQRWLRSPFPIAYIGRPPPLPLPYEYEHLGEGISILKEIINHKNAFSSVLEKAKFPTIIVGMGALQHPDALAIHSLTYKYALSLKNQQSSWNPFNVLHHAAGRVGALDIDFVPKQNAYSSWSLPKMLNTKNNFHDKNLELLYLLSCDELPEYFLSQSFVIYQGSHGDRGARYADIILPGVTWTEKKSSYTNSEGLIQNTQKASEKPKKSREDWRIIKDIALQCGKNIPLTHNDIKKNITSLTEEKARRTKFFEIKPPPIKHQDIPIKTVIEKYYLTNPVSRASATMASCHQVHVNTMAKENLES